MKNIILCLLTIIGFGCSFNSLAANSPSDQEINTALKKQLVIGKTSLKECETLFGRPVSVVENMHSKIYAFKVSAVVKGLKITAPQSSSSVASSTNSKANESAQSAQKSSVQSTATTKQDNFKREQGILKSDKQSVDKIINFVFQDNKLLSYKISSSH